MVNSVKCILGMSNQSIPVSSAENLLWFILFMFRSPSYELLQSTQFYGHFVTFGSVTALLVLNKERNKHEMDRYSTDVVLTNYFVTILFFCMASASTGNKTRVTFLFCPIASLRSYYGLCFGKSG